MTSLLPRRPLAATCFSLLALTLAAVLCVPGSARAQQDDLTDPERRAQLQRQGAGFRLGAWRVTGLEEREGTLSRSPFIEGYFQRGLDLHLALESTAGVWRQRRIVNGGQADAYVIPLYTALKFYPTRPDRTFEPFVGAGIGLALGIEDRQDDGLLGATSGTHFATGFGAKGGAGFEWRFSPAFGLAVGAAYQWVRYGDRLDGQDTFRGLAINGGLVYRFQYR
jgi:hypothetical protein